MRRELRDLLARIGGKARRLQILRIGDVLLRSVLQILRPRLGAGLGYSVSKANGTTLPALSRGQMVAARMICGLQKAKPPSALTPAAS